MQEKESFIQQFREIQPKFARVYARRLIQAKLSFPQFALLSQLANRGKVSMTEISAKMHISKPAVTHLVDRLEKNRFLKRIPYPADRRVSLLEILPKGGEMVRALQSQALGFLLKALDAFGAGERKIIARFYARLSETLEEALAETKKKKRS